MPKLPACHAPGHFYSESVGKGVGWGRQTKQEVCKQPAEKHFICYLFYYFMPLFTPLNGGVFLLCGRLCGDVSLTDEARPL